MAEEVNTGVGGALPAEPCLARVISHLDSTYMGSLEVQILRPGAGNDTSGSQVQQVKYMSPFFGTTSVEFVTNQNDYNNTQKSYGMWFVPPDVGSLVVVIFINNDPARGYWIGCVPDENMNFMVPGIAATENSVTAGKKDAAGKAGRVPVAEYNKLENVSNADPTKFKKPNHPLATVLGKQGNKNGEKGNQEDQDGLLLDDTRGITSSSARREVPSMVFGVSTPGPFDKSSGSKTGTIGKSDSKVPNAPVSHLGGSSLVMDDGDARYVRKKTAAEAGPEYASVLEGEKGDVTIPHNELVRIRTRTGHQILLHNSEDLIYITNARGTTWIEMTSNGKIDIYAQDSISVHSETDINFTAKRDINFHAVNGNINLTAKMNLNLYADNNYEIKAAKDGKLTCGNNSNIKAGINHVETAVGQIHMNSDGKPAAEAGDGYVPGRIPRAEPWKEHENLDPTSFVPEKTIAVKIIPGKTEITPPMYKKYTTSSDTFNKVKGK